MNDIQQMVVKKKWFRNFTLISAIYENWHIGMPEFNCRISEKDSIIEEITSERDLNGFIMKKLEFGIDIN